MRSTFAPTLQKSLSTSSAPSNHVSTGWNAPTHNLPTCSEYLLELRLDSKPWFLINTSKKFFSFLAQVAMKGGLAQLEIRNNHWGKASMELLFGGAKMLVRGS